MSSEVAVRTEQAVVVAKPHRTREAILKPLGITDNPALPLAKVIKDYIKSCGVTKPSDINAEYLRILKDDLQVVIDLRIRQALKDGYLMELRPGKLNKEGNEGRFSVGFIAPKAPKKLTISEQQKLVAMLGGKDSAKAKELMEYLESTGRLAKPTTRDFGPGEATPVTEPETK